MKNINHNLISQTKRTHESQATVLALKGQVRRSKIEPDLVEMTVPKLAPQGPDFRAAIQI